MNSMAIRSFIVYSNLFIAFCAIALTAEAFVLFDIPFRFYWMLAVIGCSTFLVYTLHYLIKSNTAKVDDRLDWVRHHTPLIYATSASAIICLIVLIYQHHTVFFLYKGRLHFLKILAFIVIPFLSISYSHKILPGNYKTIREWGGFKSFYLAAFWTVCTGILPLAFIMPSLAFLSSPALLSYTLLQLVCLWWLCVIFNIKDYVEDKQDGLKTFGSSLVIGALLRYGKWMALITIIVPFLFFCITYKATSSLFIIVGVVLLFFYWFALHRYQPKQRLVDFAIQYDGLIIVKAALLIFAKQF
jgi:hypothetical protein